MALVIGSHALNMLFPYNIREAKDLDVFARPVEISSTENVDAFWHESFAGTQLDRSGFATLDELYTIKVSHAYWELPNNSWQKHMFDIDLLKSHGATLDLDLHNILYPVWVEKHGKKKMNLAQAAGMFFKDAVVRIYDHDSIHDSVAFGDRPLYEAILKDGETVDIDPGKLWAMDYDTLVDLFREEIAATALERWMIPTKYKFSPGRAYHMALRKTITSLTKGKSARFIVDNFSDFKNPHDYMSIHFSKIDRLIPLENSNGRM